MAPIESEIYGQAIKDRAALLVGNAADRTAAMANMQKALIMVDGAEHQQKEARLYFTALFSNNETQTKVNDEIIIAASNRPAVRCKVAKWQEDEDSCQAQKHLRCTVCGVWKTDTALCRLSTETAVNEYVSASLATEARAQKVNESIRFARMTVKELVTIERENLRALDANKEVQPPLSAWVLIWRHASSVTLIVVLAQIFVSIFE